jgi:hypothetical protein
LRKWIDEVGMDKAKFYFDNFRIEQFIKSKRSYPFITLEEMKEEKKE